MFEESIKRENLKVSETTDVLQKTCDTLPPQEAKVAVNTLSKIIQNVLEHPTEEKYRQMKTGNKRFYQDVWRHLPAREFLILVGWGLEDEEKIVLQSNELVQEAIAALVRAKIYLEQPDLFVSTITNVPQVVIDFQGLFPQESSLVKRVIRYAEQLPHDLERATHALYLVKRKLFISGDHHMLSPFINSLYVKSSLGKFQLAIMIFEERESLLLKRQREATVDEFRTIENRLAQLATRERKLVEECEDIMVGVMEVFTDDRVSRKSSGPLTQDLIDIAHQGLLDQYEELCQKKANRHTPVGPSSASPAFVKPLDFCAYVSSLPASAQPLLDKELDWDHDGVDVHLEKIAYYMKDWETKLSSLLKLTDIDIADLKWTHRDSNLILLQRAVLRKWKEKEGFDGTYGNLLKLCCKGGDARSANSICAVLKEKVQDMEDDARELEEGTVAPSYSTSPLPTALPSTTSQLPKEASHPDPLLKRPHPLVLSREMGVLCEQWRDVGLYLDLAESTLDEIQSRPDSTPSACMTTMLKKWLTRESPTPTWKGIIEVVDFLEHQDLATKLKEKALGQ